MIFFAKNIFPYLAFSSSAIGLWVGQQQINLTQAAMAVVFVISLLAICFSRFRFKDMPPYFWFFLATIPGTAAYIFSTNDFFTPLRQYIVISIGWISVWYFFFLNKFNPKVIFNFYLNIALIAAYFGILQQIGFILGLEYLYDFRWLFIGASDFTFTENFLRVPSFFTEPSYFGLFLLPAIYFSILRFNDSYKEMTYFNCSIFITAAIFTFSTLTYIGILISAIFAIASKVTGIRFALRNFLLAGIISFLAFLAVINIPAISSRILEIPQVIAGDFSGEENISLLVNGINLLIAYEAFFINPFIGTGIGAYRVISEDILYDLFSSDQLIFSVLMSMEDNLQLADGGTMYFRLPVEIGILGCMILLWIFFIAIEAPKSDINKHIGIASLIFIFCFFLRTGQIFRFEIIYFSSIYLLTFSTYFKHLNTSR